MPKCQGRIYLKVRSHLIKESKLWTTTTWWASSSIWRPRHSPTQIRTTSSVIRNQSFSSQFLGWLLGFVTSSIRQATSMSISKRQSSSILLRHFFLSWWRRKANYYFKITSRSTKTISFWSISWGRCLVIW